VHLGELQARALGASIDAATNAAPKARRKNETTTVRVFS
jgi:hypothetical protein